MNVDRVHEILRECAQEYRKGPELTERREGNLDICEVYAMPAVPATAPDGFALVDVHFIVIGIRKERAEAQKEDLREALGDWDFQRGFSFIEVGADLGSQGAALVLFAVGEVVGFWKVVTPRLVFGDSLDEGMANKLAGAGYVTVAPLDSDVVKKIMGRSGKEIT